MGSENDILIVYHSQSGNTERLSAAVEQGALHVRGVGVRRARAAQVTCRDLRDARCLVICSPEYFGYMAGAIKDLKPDFPIVTAIRGTGEEKVGELLGSVGLEPLEETEAAVEKAIELAKSTRDAKV